MKRIISLILFSVMLVAAIAGMATAKLAGDANGDGLLDNKDVVVLFRFVSGTVKNAVEANCDYNGDNEVDNKDVVALFRALSGGTTPDKPKEYEIPADAVKIGTREELLAFADKVNKMTEDFSGKTIALTADINLDPNNAKQSNWTPLKTTKLKDAVIEGAGHTIKGMRMISTQVSGSMGFIGVASNKVTIQNITFEGAVLEGAAKHSGVVIGELNAGGKTIELDNVTVKDCIVSGVIGEQGNLDGISFRMGGLVGANIYSDTVYVHDCTVDGLEVSGFHNICGLIGCTKDKQYIVEDNTVKNATLSYSASYSKSYDATASRYFADPFYCVTDYWGEYHTDVDKSNGNKYEDIDSYDIANNIHYKNENGKNADYDGQFPVKDSKIRPKNER